jgi:ParB/RepB/Spo0J family partition protein
MNTNTQQLPDLKLVPVDDLRPSTTNPRKDFESEKAKQALAELRDSILAQGICQPILARPKPKDGDSPFEIVAGERRYRAAKLGGLDVVPCIIRPMGDREAVEIQVVENLQREDLTELEEAQSYQRLLELKDDAGVACYTVPHLAERFGVERSQIYRRLKLLDLAASDVGRTALENGKLGGRQAVLIARIPDPVARQLALDEVLGPTTSKEPMTFLETKELIERKFMQGLKGAPFKLDDATILPSAGACSACPKMTDNCSHLFSPEEAKEFAKRKVCTDPTCFRAKLDAMWKAKTEDAEKEGKTVLNERQSREVFPEWGEKGEMHHASPYVLLNEKPERSLLKPEVVDTVGTWRSLLAEAEKKTVELAIEAEKAKISKDPDLSKSEKAEAIKLLEKNPPAGGRVPRVLARDQAGVARELVERKLAIVAVETAGEPIFMGKVGSRVTAGSDDFAKQRKKELEAAQLRTAQSIEGMAQVHAALVAIWQPSPVWESLFEIAMGHAGADGLWLIGKWKGLKFAAHNTGKDEAVAKWAGELPPIERQALVPLLLIGQAMKWGGLGAEGFAQIVEGAGLGLKIEEIERAVKDRIKAEKQAKKNKAKEPKAPKKSKAEKKAEEDAEAAKEYRWNDAGVAEAPEVDTPIGGDMPEGTKCEVLLARAPDGQWRYGLALQSRTAGKVAQLVMPAVTHKKFKGFDEALCAGYTEALHYFKDDPVAFKLVAEDADDSVVEMLEGEGGAAPVAAKPEKKNRSQITDEIKSQVRALAEGGKTSQEIAKALGISAPSVHNIKKELGLLKPAGAPAFDDRNAGRVVEFPTKEDAETYLAEQAKRPYFAAYRTRVEKNGQAWDLVYEKIVQDPPVNFAGGTPVAPELMGRVIPVEDNNAKLAEWVKAYTNGMTIAEIARSYGANEADVEGALETARVTPAAAKPVALAYEFAAGDFVEWNGGPGEEPRRGYVIAIDEWQKKTGHKWDTSWIGKCRAVERPKAKNPADRYCVVEGAGLRLIKSAAEIAAKKQEVASMKQEAA